MRRSILLAFLTSGGYLMALTPVTVTVASEPHPSVLGHPVTLTATVAPAATGKVTFYDGTTILGVRALNGSQVSLTTSMLPAGARSLHAHYSGDHSHKAGSSMAVAHTVTAVGSLGFRSTSFAIGTQFSSMAEGDFNGDGIPDLVLANFAEPDPFAPTTLSVFLGEGGGNFQPAVNYEADGFPTSVAVGDFNGDGFPDLVAVVQDGVVVLLGNGDGTFQTQVKHPAGTSPLCVAVGDFNQDGIADLVVTNEISSEFSILLGKGDGTFNPAVAYSVGSYTLSVLVGDFNGDGVADLAVNADKTSIFLGNGDGTFRLAENIPIFGSAAATADFNGDGKLDLVISGVNSTSIFLGNGDGTFVAGQAYNVGGGVVVGDFNGDGKADLAIMDFYRHVNLLLGNGDGTFPTSVSYPEDVNYPGDMVAGDFNGDGKTDLVVSYSTGAPWDSRMLVLLGVVSTLSITSTHSAEFVAGGYGSYTLTVSNAPTADPAGGTVTVTETPPAGMTAYPSPQGSFLSGSGWFCGISTCTRSDALSPGASYPPITAFVNISPLAPSQGTNQASVSGGGSPTAYGSDLTTIVHGIAAMQYPIPGEILPRTSTIFEWLPVLSADQYRLDVGSAPGLTDYFSATSTATSFFVNTLPCKGQTVYVQLWTHVNGAWQSPLQYTLTAASSCATRPNTIANWKVDESTGATSFIDSSGSGNAGSCTGSGCPTMGAGGRMGTAAAFNGVNNQIMVPDSPSLRLNRFTIALWVYPTKVGADYQPLVVKEDSDGSNRNYGLYIVPNSMRIRFSVWANDCTSKIAANSLGQLVLNSWNHVAFTYDGITEELYLNGVLDSANGGGTFSLCQTAAPVKLGMEDAAFEPFGGRLDDIQILDSPLDASGVIGLYNYRAAYWKLDESAGSTTFIDSSGNSNTGTCSGDCPTMGMAGKVGTTAEFNGTSNQITVPDSVSLRLNQFTIALWVYPTQQKADYQLLVAKEDGAGQTRNYGLYIVPNSMQVRYSAWGSDCATRFAANSAGQLVLNAWNHVAFTFDGLTEKLYLNGALDSSNAAASASLCQAAVPLKMGMETSAFLPFSGSLDDVQVYSQALSDLGVLRLYDPPVAYFKLNEAPGVMLYNDASGNGNIGTCFTHCPTTGVPGRLGTAAEFNGVDDQIVILDTDALKLNQFTIALWVYPEQLRADYQPLIAKENDLGYYRNYGLYIAPNSMQVRYSAWANDCVTRYAANSTGQLALNTWNHIAFTYDGAVEKLYLNGVLDSVNAGGGLLCDTSTLFVKVGMENSAFAPFHGRLEEIQIYNQAMSAAGVMSLYSNQ